MNQFGLEKTTIEKIHSIFKKDRSIRTVLIYGSRAKGNYKPGSDIDLAIKDSELTSEQLLRLGSNLDDLNLPYTFDLCIYEELSNPDFIEHIDRVGIQFYTRQ